MTLRSRLVCLLTFAALTAGAQESTASWNVLRLPASSHAAALGGQNISLIADEGSLAWSNPALLANVSDHSFGLFFMTYAASTQWMGAHYVKALGERHTLSAEARLFNYGSMDERDATGTKLGTFSAKDFTVGVAYSYLLSDRWSGGASLKYLASHLANYRAAALSVDVGLNYYNEETDFSLSTALQNVGTQVRNYYDTSRSHLPFCWAVGISKGMEHLPVRIHATLTDLTRWKKSYYAISDVEGEKVKTTTLIFNHLVLGVDILPTDYLYLSVGYNFRRAAELKALDKSKFAGICAGGGVRIKKFQAGLSYARYHAASSSLMFNVGYHL